jgi:hypothetical protein
MGANGSGGGSFGGVREAAAEPSAPSSAKKYNGSDVRAKFVAEENIAAFIRLAGENQILVGYLTCPGAQSLVVFQRKWKSFLNGVLRSVFPKGVYVRERQSRTGDWHAHFVVNAGFDVRTGYPWAEVKARNYGAVDARIKAFWKVFRDKCEVYGFGRHNLEPIRTNGVQTSRYLVKYLSKRKNSDKQVGEERCALFGIWGVGRACNFQFGWNTAGGREYRQKIAVIARLVGQMRSCSVENLDDLKRELGLDWFRKVRRIISSDKPWPLDPKKNASWVFDEVWLMLAQDTKWDAPYYH